MKIIIVGIVKNIEEYANVVTVQIVSGDTQNALDQVNYSPYKHIWVDSVDGTLVKFDRYF